jgi:hypothetical protein
MTGLIYAVIVLAWAFYLVPRALKRHDQATRARSIERFSSAMRVLSRRSVVAPSTARPVATDPDLGAGRMVAAAPRPTLHREPPVVDAAPRAARPRPSRAAARAAAARRRRVLLALVLCLAVVGALAGLHWLPLWSPVLPVVLVLGWLLACRRQVRPDTDAYWSEVRRRASATPTRRAARVSATYRPGADSPTDGAAAARGSGAQSAVVVRQQAADEAMEEESAVQAGVEARLEQHVEAVPLETSSGEPLWDPVPVTLPTYVNKPKAPRTIRTIDLREPDSYSSGRLDEAEAVALAEHEAAAEKAAAERDRAVGS